MRVEMALRTVGSLESGATWETTSLTVWEAGEELDHRTVDELHRYAAMSAQEGVWSALANQESANIIMSAEVDGNLDVLQDTQPLLTGK